MEGTEAVVEAPSSSAPPSTPAVSEPTSTSAEPQATTERPPIKTALEVFREAEKQQRKPKAKSEITPTGEPAAATAEPVAAAAVPVKPQGPIPFDVHKTALTNARASERQQVEQEYAPIKQWATRAATDRVGFLRDVISEALQDPTLGPQIRSLAGQTLNGGRTTAPAQAPAPDFQDGQGNQFYSAKTQQARDEWLIAKVKADILGEVQPDLDQVRTEREQREVEQANRQRDAQMQTHIAEAKKSLPHFDQFKTQIHAAIEAMPLTDGHPASEAQVLHKAYWQVVGPQLSQLEQARVMKDLQSRANASSLNPASTGAPSGIPKNVRAKDGGSFENALAWATTQTAGR